MTRTHNLSRLAGPGLIFAGAAIGVSHLVQSTRAGAFFGLGLIGVILLVNLVKYPAFRFAVDYATATRKSLLSAYRELGWWVPLLFFVMVLPIPAIIVTAVGATTAGIFGAIAGDVAGTGGFPLGLVAAGVILLAVALLLIGGYRLLDKINRVLLAILVVSTLIATAAALPMVQWGSLGDLSWATEPAALLFIVALAGFMPNPTDASVALSLWVVKNQQIRGKAGAATLPEMRLAFRAPYILAVVMALCFCIMGAGVMHSAGVEPDGSAAGFAAQIIELYRQTLGSAGAVIAAVAALSVMLTTVIAALDAYARTFAEGVEQFLFDPADREQRGSKPGWSYPAMVCMIALFAVLILMFLFGNFALFIDISTTIAFLVSPIVALLNHLVMTRCAVPEEARPSAAMVALSWTGIISMTALAAAFFVLI